MWFLPALTVRTFSTRILDAETAEESFDRNPRGTHIVRAAQLGCYSPERGFTKYPWLPGMNSPLFAAGGLLFAAPQIGAREFEIGKVPSTDVGAVVNVDELVEYHTAILGVTGTGKTELALDIVREAVKRDVKVFCVDFTGDYRLRLEDLAPSLPSPTPEQGAELEASCSPRRPERMALGRKRPCSRRRSTRCARRLRRKLIPS